MVLDADNIIIKTQNNAKCTNKLVLLLVFNSDFKRMPSFCIEFF